jgi:hypothetical protein
MHSKSAVSHIPQFGDAASPEEDAASPAGDAVCPAGDLLASPNFGIRDTTLQNLKIAFYSAQLVSTPLLQCCGHVSLYMSLKVQFICI